ncbi:MAG TPA: hypothetical protein VLC53_18205, partial [Myxococcota bacterium]|nr:hypothetical protein [Myxococcota bacterium]
MTKTPWIVIGVIACGLVAGSPPLHAQTPGAVGPPAPPAPPAPPGARDVPRTAAGDDEPWSRGVPTAVQEAARAVFLEGNRLFKIPLFAKEVEKFTEALGTWEHPAFYFNLAL